MILLKLLKMSDVAVCTPTVAPKMFNRDTNELQQSKSTHFLVGIRDADELFKRKTERVTNSLKAGLI